MIDIEVTVSCIKCGATEGYWATDTGDAENFLYRLENDGWADELDICPSCAEKTIKCSYCSEETLPGVTEEELPEYGWRQYTSANMKTLLTLCKQCGEYYDQFRS